MPNMPTPSAMPKPIKSDCSDWEDWHPLTPGIPLEMGVHRKMEVDGVTYYSLLKDRGF